MTDYYETQDASPIVPNMVDRDSINSNATSNGFQIKIDDISAEKPQKTEFNVNEEHFSKKHESVITDISDSLTRESNNLEMGKNLSDYNTVQSNTTKDEEVNKNKPWRKVIRRRIANG